MLHFLTVTNLPASSTIDLMQAADQGRIRQNTLRPRKVTMAINATAVEANMRIFAGTREIVGLSRVAGGGTAGVFPALDQFSFSFWLGVGEDLAIELTEDAGTGTVDLNAVISIQPA